MVSSGWWPATPPQQRQNLVAGRMLALPDGTWWLFGAWARWYRYTPADRQWYLFPPPQSSITRMSARPLQQGMAVPQIPPHIVPGGADFSYDPPPALAFIGHDVPDNVTARVRATIESAAALPAADYPHRWGLFSSTAPSTVAVAWGVMLWSATAPVFDGRLDDQLIGLWSSYRARPLPEVDGPRWLTPPPLETLIGLYAERLRSGRVDAAVVILRTMWAMANALRADSRFRARADALIAILGETLGNPTVDYGALPYGDQALVQQWLARCPPDRAPALRIEASAGEHFRNAYYDLAIALGPVSGDPAEPGYVEPRLIAAALLAADLAVVRKDVSTQVVAWLDPEIRYTVQAVLDQNGHPLRRMWPEANRLPGFLRDRIGAAGRSASDTLVATMYAADLAWCRLGGGIPARPRGFPASTAILAELLGSRRATTTAPADPVTPTPGLATLAPQYPSSQLGQAQPVPAAPPAQQPPTGPPGQPPGWTPPGAADPPSSADSGLGYAATMNWQPGEDGIKPTPADPPRPAGEGTNWPPPGQPAPGDAPMWRPPPAKTAEPADRDPPPASGASPVLRPTGVDPAGATMLDSGDGPDSGDDLDDLDERTTRDPAGPGRAVHATHLDRSDGTRLDVGSAARPAPPVVPPRPRTRLLAEPGGGPPERPGTRILSETMLGDILDAPMPERPVAEIEPPSPAARMPEVTERHGIRFVSGADDAGDLLDEVHSRASQAGPPSPAEGASAPGVLIVGAPHSGQRRITRLIAHALADTGAGDGTVRTAHPGELSGDPSEALVAELRAGGAALLFEGLDSAILNAPDPGRVAAAVVRERADAANRTVLIATCEPAAYSRLEREFPELTRGFRVFRLPDFEDSKVRLALLHVLADERRVTVAAPALISVQADLPRLRGRGDLVNARLVEGYLERACARHTQRAGASRDRLVLTPEDFAGIAEEIEPALRPPGDVDDFLGRLDQMIGLDEVKRTVEGLAAEARMAADRSAQGLPTGNPSRNMIFLGKPGTGKTTVAGLVGGIYAALNLLDTGHVVSCNARDFAGDDAAGKVTAHADRATGGVLMIEDSHLLDRMSAAVSALVRLLEDRRDKFMVICASHPGELDGFLLANPGFQAQFGAILDFGEPTDRQLVRMFTRYAERDLYLLDEELRVELLERFAEMRRSPDFAFADTVRRLFDQTVARQAARLAGAQVNAATVARLTVRDLPATPAEQLLRDLHQDRSSR